MEYNFEKINNFRKKKNGKAHLSNLINVLIGTLPLPELSLHHADGRFRRRTVDALAFHAVHEMAAETLLTVLVGVRIVQHVVRADQLVAPHPA